MSHDMTTDTTGALHLKQLCEVYPELCINAPGTAQR